MHRYLITLHAFKARKVFTEGPRVLKVLGILQEVCWKHRFDTYAYCFLPDRLVLIVRGKTEFSDMKAFLSAFRQASNTALEAELDHPLWKRIYTERVLRKKEESAERAAEVFSLPVQAGLVTVPSDYPYLGSFVKVATSPSGRGKRKGRRPARRSA
jgi:REP element-mobilizing transposase RayT